jgi:hypothetical protein
MHLDLNFNYAHDTGVEGRDAATTFVIGTVIRRRDAAMPIARLVGMKPF